MSTGYCLTTTLSVAAVPFLGGGAVWVAFVAGRIFLISLSFSVWGVLKGDFAVMDENFITLTGTYVCFVLATLLLPFVLPNMVLASFIKGFIRVLESGHVARGASGVGLPGAKSSFRSPRRRLGRPDHGSLLVFSTTLSVARASLS